MGEIDRTEISKFPGEQKRRLTLEFIAGADTHQDAALKATEPEQLKYRVLRLAQLADIQKRKPVS
jgi:hypothetical protein